MKSQSFAWLSFRGSAVFAAFAVLICFCAATSARAATFTVDTIADDAALSACTAADGDCSLRGAVAAANLAAGDDTIDFSALFNTAQTIVLSGTDIIINNNGKLDIAAPLNRRLTVSGNNASRVFTNNTGAVTGISNLRVTGGNGVSTISTLRGGGVYNNAGALTLTNVVVSGNSTANGGGLSNAGTGAVLNLINCTVSNNTATGAGGGTQNFAGVTTNITNSTFTGNTSNSTSTGGGAMQANGIVRFTNSTFSGNTATGGNGGAIYYNGTSLIMINTTIAANTATNGAGGLHKATATLNAAISNTIVGGNTGGAPAGSPDVIGAISSGGNNLIQTLGTSTGWVASDLLNVNPLLAPLGNYGGATLTHAFTAASLALDGGTATGASAADQRGAARVNAVDIGAFELNTTAFTAFLPAGRSGQAYNQTLAPNNVINGVTFTYSLLSGTLPPNITLTTALAPQAVVALAGTPPNNPVTTAYNFVIRATGSDGSFVDTAYGVTILSPTAANVTVGGRITAGKSRGISSVRVTLTDSAGQIRVVLSGSLGYYRFANVPAGATYIISVAGKKYTFNQPEQIRSVVEDTDDINFVADN